MDHVISSALERVLWSSPTPISCLISSAKHAIQSYRNHDECHLWWYHTEHIDVVASGTSIHPVVYTTWFEIKLAKHSMIALLSEYLQTLFFVMYQKNAFFVWLQLSKDTQPIIFKIYVQCHLIQAFTSAFDLYIILVWLFHYHCYYILLCLNWYNQ